MLKLANVLKVNKFGRKVALGMPLQFYVQMRTSRVENGTCLGNLTVDVVVVNSTLYVTSSNCWTTPVVTLTFAPAHLGGTTWTYVLSVHPPYCQPAFQQK